MESVVNTNVNNSSVPVGIINPPDRFYKPVLYSHVQATKDFNKLENDIYVSLKHSEKLEKRKTPPSVFVALGLGALAIGFPFLRKLIKR